MDRKLVQSCPASITKCKHRIPQPKAYLSPAQIQNNSSTVVRKENTIAPDCDVLLVGEQDVSIASVLLLWRQKLQGRKEINCLYVIYALY